MSRATSFPAALFALALVSACVAPPPAAVETIYGTVRADTPEQALAVAHQLEMLRPAVAARVPDTRDGPVDVWVQSEVHPFPFTPDVLRQQPGVTVEAFWLSNPRIHLRSVQDELPTSLVHELVHALAGASWRALPAVLEEGMCDLVGMQLQPDSTLGAQRLWSAAHLFRSPGTVLAFRAPAVRGLELLAEDTQGLLSAEVADALSTVAEDGLWMHVRWKPEPREEPVELDDVLRIAPSRLFFWSLSIERLSSAYGLGYLLTERIAERRGLDGLRELCLAAASEGLSLVPAEVLLEAAEVRDEHHLVELAWARLGPAELEDYVAANAHGFAATLVQLRRGLGLEWMDAATFLAESEPLLRFENGVRLELARVDALVAAFAEFDGAP